MSYWLVAARPRHERLADRTLFMSRQLVPCCRRSPSAGWHRLGNVRGVILVLAGAATFLLTGYQFHHLPGHLAGASSGAAWAPTMALYDGILVNETRARGFNYGSLRV